jgi:hypothetical protein
MPFLNPKLGIDFSNYIADRTRDFTGRTWVFEAIRDWWADSNGERFFLLTGEPGSGKTAIVARLAQFAQGTETFPGLATGFLQAVHFCSARDSIWIDPKEFARSLALQLAASIPEFGLALKDIGEKTTNITVEQSFGTVQNSDVKGVVIGSLTISGLTGQEAFTQVVVNPLRQIQQDGFSQPVTILVDSLDEALTHDGDSTIVRLLATLSTSVKLRLILTSRNEGKVKEKLLHYKELFLSTPEHLEQNQRDVRDYIHLRLSREETLRLQAETGDRDSLITTLTDKSEGNFLYIRFLLDAVVSGQQNLTNPVGLSQGLDELYSASLRRVVELGNKDWSEVYAPVMGVLLAAQASLRQSQIEALTQLKESVVWNALNDLEQFLDEVESEGGETLYRLYHQSVTDFLGKQQLLIDQKKLKNRYYLPTEEQHQRFVNYYRPEGQPWSEVNLEQMDGYGRRYLPQHLVKAGQAEELHLLLALEKDGKPAWFRLKDDEGDTDGFLEDLALASNTAASEALKQIDTGEAPVAIALSARYRLIRATIGDLAHAITPELGIRALELGLWEPSRAISMARQTPPVLDRVERYRLLLASSAVVEPYRSQVEKLACGAIDAWHDLPAYPLVALSEHLSKAARETVLRKALEAAIQYPETREKSSQAMKAIGMQDYYSAANSAARESAHALAAVTARFAGQLREVATQQGLTFVNQISDPKEKAHALGAWLHLLPDSQKHDKLQEALAAAHAIDNQQEKIFALAAIAGGLNDDEKIDVLEMVWQLSEDISDEPWRAFCLSRVAPQLKGDKRRMSLELGLRNLETERGWTLIRSCAPTLEPSERAEVLAVIQNVSDRNKRVEMLIELGFAINRDDIEFAFRDALAENYPWSRDQKLAKLSPQLPADLLQKALELSLLTVSSQETSLLDQIAHLLPREDQNKASSNGAEVSRMLIWEHIFRDKPLWEYGSVHSLISVSDNLSQEPTDVTPEEQETTLQTELERVTQITDESAIWAAQKKAYALELLIPRLISPNHLEEALGIAQQIPDGWCRSQPLLALAMRFESNRREQILQEAVDAVLEPGPANGDRRAAVIEQMVSVLTIPLLKKVLDGVQVFDEWGRIRALKAIFPRIETELLSPALEAIRVLSNDDTKRELIGLIANKLTCDWVASVLEICEDITDEEQRTAVLEVIAPIAQANDRETILRMQESLSSAGYRVRVLAKLLLPEPNSKQLLRLIRRELLEHLEHGVFTSRSEVLQFLSIKYIFTEPILDYETLSRIIDDSQKICQIWRWG